MSIDTPRQGAALDELLQRHQRESGKKLGLAIEISAENQTPAEYQTFLERKRAEHEDKIAIYADFDLGHMERSRSLRPNQSIDPAVQILADVLEDPKRAKHVKIISLNQYVRGAVQTHSQPDKGDIDIEEAVRLMGRSMRDSKLEDATALFETHPSHYQWFFSQEGLVFCQNLQESFNQSAGRV